MDETFPPRRSSSADTLVNAAIKSHQEAEGHHRHGGFNRQLSESLGLIQGILNGRRLSHHPLHGSRPSNVGFEALHDKGPCHDHLEKSDEEHSNGININHRGSVLGSLLQLESHLAQRRSVSIVNAITMIPNLYILEHEIPKEKVKEEARICQT